jgi:hypothetical protein
MKLLQLAEAFIGQVLIACNQWQDKRDSKDCENHGRPGRKLHYRGAAFCNKISVVRRSETEGDSQKNDSAV